MISKLSPYYAFAICDVFSFTLSILSIVVSALSSGLTMVYAEDFDSSGETCYRPVATLRHSISSYPPKYHPSDRVSKLMPISTSLHDASIVLKVRHYFYVLLSSLHSVLLRMS